MFGAAIQHSLDSYGVAPQMRLVLGFSGGADSLALLHALRAAGRPVLAAHLDHGLRPVSAEQAEQAGRLARQLGADFVSQRLDVAALAREQQLSLEAAARQLRYRFLFEVAAKHQAAAVLTAHQADDQAETLLMHLLRGAGPAGLQGMQFYWLPNPWSGQIPLVRPLLSQPRRAVQAYLQAQGLEPLEDESNTDRRFFRNRLRHELLPQLEALAPGAAARLAQTGDLLGAEEDLLAGWAAAAWQRCLGEQAPDWLSLQRPALRAEPLALQRRVLRQAWLALGAPGELGFAHVQAALALALQPGQAGRLDWPGGLQLWVEGDTLWLAVPEAQPPTPWPQVAETPLALAVPGEVALAGGWRLRATWQPAPPADFATEEGWQTWLDLGAQPGPLQVRRPAAGDRWQPLGSPGSQKLADFFSNLKLPHRARAAWPLVCCGDVIVWVAGHRPAEVGRVRPDSQQVLHLQLLHPA